MLVLYFLTFIFLLSNTLFFLPDVWQMTSTMYLVVSSITLIVYSLYAYSANLSFKRKFQKNLWPIKQKYKFFMPLLSYFLLFIILDIIIFSTVNHPDYGPHLINMILAKYFISIYLFMISHIAFNYVSGLYLLMTSFASMYYFYILLLPPIVIVLICLLMIGLAYCIDVLRNKWHWIRNTKFICFIFGLFLFSNFGFRSSIYNLIHQAYQYNIYVDIVTIVLLVAGAIFCAYLINNYSFKVGTTILMIGLPILLSYVTYALFNYEVMTLHLDRLLNFIN